MLGIVFPGQGSQKLGMLSDIANEFPIVLDTFAQASSVLGYDLWQLTQHSPVELDKTEFTQPALLAASYAIWRILNPKNVTVLAGHSLGEYTALTAAGALDFASAIKIASARGQYMQAAVAEGVGAMGAIIGLDEQEVMTICQSAKTHDDILQPANFNSIGQTVIAGHKIAVERALKMAKEKGAKLAVIIPVSVPSHCQLMQPAADKLAALLAKINFSHLHIPVLNNADVQLYTSAENTREGLVKQLTQPVQWVKTIQTFIKMGVNCIIECGPGKVLTGLNKRIDKNIELMTTADLNELLLARNRIQRGIP
jgi:[acyl-carrier-protein] S-malonyltransferase